MSLSDGWDPPRPGWTCSECGFGFDATRPDAIAAVLRSTAARYARPLTRGLPGEDLDALVRLRPEAAVWSALEYACHVRDALALYDWRIGKALSEDRPDFPPMGRDDLADERRYNDQNPLLVIGELVAGAERLADLLAPVQGPTWDRSGVREGQELTVAWMAKNVLHECEHHLLDIGRVLRRVRGR